MVFLNKKALTPARDVITDGSILCSVPGLVYGHKGPNGFSGVDFTGSMRPKVRSKVSYTFTFDCVS